MNKTDVAAITIKKSFNKKWWDSKRTLKVRGSGTGEALEEWKKQCPEDVAALKDPADVEKAEATCEKVRKTLKTALSKAGDDEHMVAGIKKMMKLIDEYEVELLNQKKAQTNKYAELNSNLQDVIDLTRQLRQALPQQANTIKDVRKRVEEYEEAADMVELLDESGKQKLLREITDDEGEIDKVDKAVSNMALAVKKADGKYREDVYTASKDAKFRPTLERYRKGTAEFDAEHSEVYDGVTELRRRLSTVKLIVEKGETVEGAIEELKKLETIMGSMEIAHFRETVEIMKERTPTIMEWSKNPSAMTDKNWERAALWEDDAKGAMDKVPTTTRTLENAKRDLQRYARKYGENTDVKRLLATITKLYNEAIADRGKMLKFSPPYRKQLESLLEKHHS